jgi:energy-coupling factor transport system ATP-binding protein
MAIKFEKVGYDYYGADGTPFKAIDNINLSIEETSEFIALIGETGSGKSTLIQHMNALLRPTRGTVVVYGITVHKDIRKKEKNIKLNHLRKQVGLVFQFPDYQLFEETVEKDIMFGPKNFGASVEEAKLLAKEALAKVGLPEEYLTRSPFNLSGGEKKRVSIAGILAMKPDILVLDEPTSGLDPLGRDELLELFKKINEEEHKTVIIITHDMNIVQKYAKRVLVMSEGHLVFDGKTEELFQLDTLDQWNIDKPDILLLTKEIEKQFNITINPLPKNVEDLYKRLKEVFL